jgi:pyruvate dehydrogenase E1 component alpha subunit
MAALKKETLLEWYRQMVLIRQFEDKCADLYFTTKQITGVYMHLYSGHEAVGVGALGALRPSDHVITAYRDHGLALIRGVPADAVMAEMLGKRTGTSGGKGGSMHIASRAHNFWGGYAIVGGHLPLATGLALGARYTNTDEVVVSMIGDGATNNGYFHEALNMSQIWDLPNIWIIENNLVGMGTRIEDASGQTELHKRAIAFGMKDMGRVDGQDVFAMYDTMTEAVDYARKSGPVLIEALTYRYEGHGVSDKTFDKRFADELKVWEARDPIQILTKHITTKYKNMDAELESIKAEMGKVVEQSVEFALNSPDPDMNDLVANVYVGRDYDVI